MDKTGHEQVLVLVVEDESLIRMEAVDMLEEVGFKVVEAANSTQAMKILETQPIDVLFTDIDMPGGIDGLELAAFVKKRWPHIALLVTSGQVRISINDLPQGGKFFAKPYRAKQVTEVISDVVKDQV